MNNYGVGLARSRATPDVPAPPPGITPQLQRHATLHYVSRTQTTLWCTFSKSARQIRLNERSGSGARLLDTVGQRRLRECAGFDAWLQPDLDNGPDHRLRLVNDIRRGKEPHSVCQRDELLFIAAQLDLVTDLSLEKQPGSIRNEVCIDHLSLGHLPRNSLQAILVALGIYSGKQRSSTSDERTNERCNRAQKGGFDVHLALPAQHEPSGSGPSTAAGRAQQCLSAILSGMLGMDPTPAGRCSSEDGIGSCSDPAGRGAWIRGAGAMPPTPFWAHAMRADSGRPSSSMRFRTWTATSISVARRSSVRERSPSPITRLNRPMVASVRARAL